MVIVVIFILFLDNIMNNNLALVSLDSISELLIEVVVN